MANPFGDTEKNPFGDKEKKKGIGEIIAGGIEGAATIGSSLLAEPIAGIAGLSTALNPFQEEGAGGARVQQVRDALTYKPKLEGAKQALANVGEAIQPLSAAMSGQEKRLGDYVMEKTGSPELASIAHTLPSAILEMLGLSAFKGGKSAKQAGDVAQAQNSAQKAITNSEDITGIRRLTTDVIPPETRMGKFMQQQGEMLTGGNRAAQQAERISSVERLLANYDVTDAARYERSILDGIKNSIDKSKAQMGALYDASTKKLDGMGVVGLNKTKRFAENSINKESIKGSLADSGLVDDMAKFIEAPDDLSFETIKSIRSAVGNKLKLAKQGAPVQGNSNTSSLSQLYKAISDDMESFAKSVDPELAKKWKMADREFSGFATGSNKAGVRRLIKTGDATPEDIDLMLFSNKQSDVDFIKNNIDETGKQALKQRLLQKVMQKTSLGADDINPNKFASQLDKMRMQFNAIFDKDELKAIEGIKKALNETRRAQDASVATASGQQTIPLIAWIKPTVLIPGLIQSIIETPKIRNIIIRRNAAKTDIAKRALDNAMIRELNASGLIGVNAPTLLNKDDGGDNGGN